MLTRSRPLSVESAPANSRIFERGSSALRAALEATRGGRYTPAQVTALSKSTERWVGIAHREGLPMARRADLTRSLFDVRQGRP